MAARRRRGKKRLTLRQGMRGLRVKALQERLNAKGAKLEADGVYGAKTAAAVKKYGEV